MFNKVIIRNKTERAHNIHLAVHPFKLPRLYMLNWRGNYGTCYEQPLPEALHTLADKLWDEIPGLSCLFFSNGEITLQHNGLFTDNEIIEHASSIIEPFLQEQLLLNALNF